MHDVLLPSVANAFRCFMRLEYLNHDPPTLLLFIFSGTVKDSYTSQDWFKKGGLGGSGGGHPDITISSHLRVKSEGPENEKQIFDIGENISDLATLD